MDSQGQPGLALAVTAGHGAALFRQLHTRRHPVRAIDLFRRDQDPLFVLAFTVSWEIAANQYRLYTFRVAETQWNFLDQLWSFRRSLWGWLLAATGVLLAAQGLILRWSLKPLRRVATEVTEIEAGRRAELSGDYPEELQPLTVNLNALLRQGHAHFGAPPQCLGDLAHSLKTPLAVMRGALDNGTSHAELRRTLQEQLERMNRTVDYQLQWAAASGRIALSTPLPVAPVARKILDSLAKVYADRAPSLSSEVGRTTVFYGDEGDLMEILGTWPTTPANGADSGGGARLPRRSRRARRTGGGGRGRWPGIPPDQAPLLLDRGRRADPSVAGHGIGLAVVRVLVEVYYGQLDISRGSLGGRWCGHGCVSRLTAEDLKSTIRSPYDPCHSGFALIFLETTTNNQGIAMLSIATFSLCNLGADAPPARLAKLGAIAARDLGGPDILAVQEIMAETPPMPDGQVPADLAYRALSAAVVDAGGPRYEFRKSRRWSTGMAAWPAPIFRSGCSSIRCGSVSRSGPRRPEDSTGIRLNGGRPSLTLNPAVSPPASGLCRRWPHHWAPSRKTLAAEFELRGQRLFVIVCHFKVHALAHPPRGGLRQKAATRPGRNRPLFRRRSAGLRPARGDRGARRPERRAGLQDPENPQGAICSIICWRICRADKATPVGTAARPQALDHILVSPALRLGQRRVPTSTATPAPANRNQPAITIRYWRGSRRGRTWMLERAARGSDADRLPMSHPTSSKPICHDCRDRQPVRPPARPMLTGVPWCTGSRPMYRASSRS